MNKLKKLLAKLLAKGFATKSEQEAVDEAVASAIADGEQLDSETQEQVDDVKDLPENSDDSEDGEEGEGDDDVDEDGIDAKTLKSLVSKKVQRAVKASTKAAAEAAAEILVKQHFDGVAKNRKTVRNVEANTEKFAESKEFFTKFFSGDTASLKAAGYTDTDTSGSAGYLVPPAEFLAEVYRIQDVYGVARRDMRYIRKSGAGNEITIPALGTTVNTFWTDQAGAKKSTQPTFNLPSITLKKLAAIVPWTEEFAEDVGVDYIGLLAQLFAEALAKQEDLAFFAGDGTSTYGGYTGILNNADVNSVVLTGDEFTDLTADKLLEMQDETPAGALTGSKYYMHRSILSIIRTLKDTQGNYIYQAPGGNQPATLWNYPVETVEAMPAAGDTDADTPFVIFGNLANTAVISDKGTLNMKLFDSGVVRNVTDNGDLNLITQDMQALRVVRRVGFTIALPKGITVLKTGSGS